MNIYVGNIPRAASEEDLRTAFEAHGKVTAVNIIKDKFTGESRGFGFVEMANSTEAKAAISGVDGTEMMGRTLIVNEARPRKEQRGGGGGGGRGRSGGGSGGGFRRNW